MNMQEPIVNMSENDAEQSTPQSIGRLTVDGIVTPFTFALNPIEVTVDGRVTCSKLLQP